MSSSTESEREGTKSMWFLPREERRASSAFNLKGGEKHFTANFSRLL